MKLLNFRKKALLNFLVSIHYSRSLLLNKIEKNHKNVYNNLYKSWIMTVSKTRVDVSLPFSFYVNAVIRFSILCQNPLLLSDEERLFHYSQRTMPGYGTRIKFLLTITKGSFLERIYISSSFNYSYIKKNLIGKTFIKNYSIMQLLMIKCAR